MQIHVTSSIRVARPIFMAVVHMMLVVLPCIGQAYEDLLFFRATKNRDIARNDDRSKYELMTSSSSGDEVFVEKLPVVRVPITQVESILIEKEPILRIAVSTPSANPPKVVGPDHIYTATFVLGPEGAQNVRDVTATSRGDLLAIAIDSQRLAIASVYEPLEGNDFTVYLDERNEGRLENIFSPLKDKVVWLK